MKGKVCVVTGANAGIGLETARELARRGATVLMGARDQARGAAAVADVRASTGGSVELLMVDLASLASVRRAAARVLDEHERLDLLINNAGLVLGERRVTEDGFEATFAINHLGHFELTRCLLDRLKASAPARIINVASDAHRGSRGLHFDDLACERRRYRAMKVYADSKLANILFTRELAARLEGTGVVAHAVHPGVVRSGFARDGDLHGLAGWVFRALGPFLLSPEEGAATTLHVALSEDAARSSGEYWARCTRRQPQPPALDDAAARRLWEVSEDLIESATR